MPESRLQPIQQSFAGGEISPRMNARSDTDGYQQSAEILENFVPYAQGPINKRFGDEWMQSVSGDFGRVFDFYVSTNVGFTVIITTDTITVADNSGTVLEDDETTNGDFIDGPLGWTVDTNSGGSNVLFHSGLVELNPGLGVTRYAGIHQNITTINATADIGMKITTETGEGDLLVEVGTTEGANDVYSSTFSSSNNIVITIPATGVTSLWFSFRAPGGAPTKILDKIEVVDLDNIPGRIEFPSPWPTPTDVERIQYDMPPGADEMYFFNPNIAPQGLIYDKALRTWSFGELALTPPGLYSYHTWEDGNWPYAVTFAQGRMWLAGLNDFGEVFWGSRSGLFFDFELPDPEGTDIAPDDPFEFEMATKGAICWIVGAKNVIIGTEAGEHIVTSEGGVIMPGDIQVEQQSANGSAFVQPEQIGNRVLYVSGDRRKVREMGYQWQEAGWLTRDLTFMSEHITENNLIRRIKYAKNPDSVITIVTIPGDIIACTYERSVDILAWHKHTTYGKVIDMTILSTGGYSSKWLLTDRDEDGNDMFVERDTRGEYLDASAYKYYEVETTSIGPFLHLANRTVSVKIDGAMHPDILLDNDGNGTVQYPGNAFVVGYGYTAYFRSLPLDKGAQSGSAMGMMKRWNKVWVRVYNSAMPTINGVRPPTRLADTPMNEPEPLDSDDVQVTTLDNTMKGQLDIAQELPLRTMIIGIFGEMSQRNID